MLSGLAKPCGIFWDIENVDVPKNCAAAVIAQNIRATLVFPNQLVEREFFCVCNVHQLPIQVGTSLESIGVTIVQPFYQVKENAADTKIVLLISKFIKNWGSNGCAIVVVTGDSDFIDPLLKMKLNYDLTVYIIHPKASFSKELLWAADFSFQLEGVLLIETTPTAVFRGLNRSGFIKISDLPQNFDSHSRIHDINKDCARLCNGSRILRISRGTVWIGYIQPNRFMTNNELKIFSSLKFSEFSPRVELVKALWTDMVHKVRYRRPKSEIYASLAVSNGLKNNRDKQSNTCVIALPQFSQSTNPNKELSRDPIKDKSKDQIKSPNKDQIKSPNKDQIKSPNKDQTKSPSKSLNNPLIKLTLPRTLSDQKPSQKEIDFRIIRKKFICLSGSPNSEYTTHWSLMCNIVKRSLEYGINKVILEGSDFWLEFRDEENCSRMADIIMCNSHFLKPLIMKKSISPSKKLVQTLSTYQSDIPFCLNRDLNLNYLRSSNLGSITGSDTAQLVERVRSISGNYKCVFVKLFEGTIWAGFPSNRTCENAKKKINSLRNEKLQMQLVQFRLFPVHIYETISKQDFVGESKTLINLWVSKKFCFQASNISDDLVSMSLSVETNTDSRCEQ